MAQQFKIGDYVIVKPREMRGVSHKGQITRQYSQYHYVTIDGGGECGGWFTSSLRLDTERMTQSQADKAHYESLSPAKQRVVQAALKLSQAQKEFDEALKAL